MYVCVCACMCVHVCECVQKYYSGSIIAYFLLGCSPRKGYKFSSYSELVLYDRYHTLFLYIGGLAIDMLLTLHPHLAYQLLQNQHGS